MISLTDDQIPDHRVVGAKAVSLSRMHALGCRIPPGFVFDTSYNESLIKQAGLQERIQWLEEHGPLLKESYVLEIGRDITQQLRKTLLPPAFGQDLKTCFDMLGRGDPPLICRSSCLLEDSQEKAYPGIFLSEAGLTSLSDLRQAVVNCLCSLFEPRALRYWLRLQRLQPRFSMGLVIQQIVPTTYAGVMFFWNSETILIEGLRGTGEFFMSGQVRPVCYRRNAQGTWEMSGRGVNGGDILETERLDQLARIGSRAAREWDSRVDIEFGFQGRSESPYIFQCRPVTMELPGEETAPSTALTENTGFKGLSCAPGVIRGLAIDPAVSGGGFDNTSKRILVLESLTERDYDRIFDVAGIITEQVGSQLNHLSIACRELGIPYVSGIEDARARLHGRHVVVDGRKGRVFLQSDDFPHYEKHATVQDPDPLPENFFYLPYLEGKEGGSRGTGDPLYTGSLYLIIESLYRAETEEELIEYMTRQLKETLGRAAGQERFMVKLPQLSEEELSILNRTIDGKSYSRDSLNQLFQQVYEEAATRLGLRLSIQK